MKKFFFIFAVFLLVVNLNTTFSKADQAFWEPIRVGLFYDKSALESYELASQNGFILGFKQDGKFSPIIEIDENNIEVSGIDPGNYIPVKENMKTIQEAREIISQLASTKKDCYFFYNGNWSVWAKGPGNSGLDTGKYILVTSSSLKIILPVSMERPAYFSPTDGQKTISLNGRRYRGLIEILPSQGRKITAVNELEMEDYLYGVLPLEMPANWPLEALKAQAVASRTYALYNLSKWEKLGFDICGNTQDQAYGGFDVENTASNEAVDETKGQYILYNDKPIMALYHADSGGITEDSKDALGSDLSYLKPVEDSFDKDSPNSVWNVSLSLEDINEKIGKIYTTLGKIVGISIVERTTSGRVKSIMIEGTSGNKILSGSEIRNILQLKSTLFDIQDKGANLYVVSGNSEQKVSVKGRVVISARGLFNLAGRNTFLAGFNDVKNISLDGNGFEFSGRGWGHGIGMSQWGAKGMAEQGYNYKQILQHYYKNVEIK
ncbi:MAG TPA: SpoIID/LytB domain-containing protein [Thermoanaerobacterales bacterium]|nr:SpoIID/LytB domain-containing protein [Thermoanaerobacterales bacterium]